LLLVSNSRTHISIKEDPEVGIYCSGLSSEVVKNKQEMVECLKRGSLTRTTAHTLMNATSSRSHAIFTVKIENRYIGDFTNKEGEINEEMVEGINQDFLTAKFHFVDLAGSERLKKSGAEGQTAKEGININKSLLTLGQVINALTKEYQGKLGHIP